MNKARTLSYVGNFFFVSLLGCCLVLLAWLSTRSNLQFDVTSSNTHTLSADGQRLLELADDPLTILAFAGDHATQKRIKNFIARYQQHKADLMLRFIDPWQRPDEVSRYKVGSAGELVILYGDRKISVTPKDYGNTTQLFNEKEFNAVLQKLLRAQKQTIYFVAGHGERPIDGKTNHGLVAWTGLLRNRGFTIADYAVSTGVAVPEDASLLVLSQPQLDWLLPELLVLRQYIERGGALLWLNDPGPDYGLDPLAQLLHIGFSTEKLQAQQALPGVDSRSLLSPDPLSYPNHPIMRAFRLQILLPQAVQVQVPPSSTDSKWQYRPLVMAGNKKRAVALALTRAIEDTDATQRIVVFGDGDFLSNTYIHNGGNAELGIRIVDWLTGNDNLIATLEESPDTTLAMPEHIRTAIASFYLLGLPILLLLLAWIVHYRRTASR